MADSKSDREPDLLLFSLGEFQELIGQFFDLLLPDSICEIGINGGGLSTLFVDLCKASGGHYTGIDTQIGEEWVNKMRGESTVVHRGGSLEFLPDLPSHDVYIIDGDHNYYTVYHELEAILAKSPRPRTVILHDVAWPCARRDLYYAPESIPESERHPFSYSLGTIPGEPTLQKGGYSGNGDFAWALEEGGPKNGVLSAVEDAILDFKLGAWKLVTVPVIFGIGFLYDPNELKPEALGFFDRLSESERTFVKIFEALELNRLRLYLELGRASKFINSLQEHINESHRDYAELAATFEDLSQHSEVIGEHASKLLKAYKELSRYAEKLEGERTGRR